MATFQNTDYWAIILGGSSGLGLASAKKLAQQGMNICIIHRNSRSEMELIKTNFDHIKSNGIQFLSFNADALNKEKTAELITEIKTKIGEKGRIRCLVHSIAKGNLKPMTSQTESILSSDDFQITLYAMAISLYDWTKAIFESKLFSEDARIISFTSEGNAKAMPYYGAVSAAKAALEAISRNIALEFAPYGIRSNCIQAGVTDTQSLQMIPNSEKIISFSAKRNPFKRLTTPEDVANVVYLLCRDEASWINGATIPVDGGERIC
ncbi:enoyl-ACP reductase [Flavobacterium sp. GT3R68]|uniref:enoyl-ACP reductase FabI n=1 Tax=Flavobacterium sp. GT3R68 TaxID=2594437 RepID=UPI000F87A74F|nr:SDR family oxidoreductase [Flavobacterium sp. GT3R68]RTY93655.1 SDR family oxidoreductase [Flavobacterium sp. GSN2]TRW91624.1 SDR family oxidoreductase [Flavobacterium sp. GT3R68]